MRRCLRMRVKERPWEVWHSSRMAQQLDAYWRNSPDEMAYRTRLAVLVRDHMAMPNDSILEVGCGTGLVYEALRDNIKSGLVYTGMDNSSQMVAAARKAYPGVTFRRGDAFQLPAEDGAFDIACAFEVFGHMPAPAPAIAELIRVARHTAIFTMWVWDGQGPRQGADHYEHSPHEIEMAIVGAYLLDHIRLRWEWVQLPYTRAYIVRKVLL